MFDCFAFSSNGDLCCEHVALLQAWKGENMGSDIFQKLCVKNEQQSGQKKFSIVVLFWPIRCFMLLCVRHQLLSCDTADKCRSFASFACYLM